MQEKSFPPKELTVSEFEAHPEWAMAEAEIRDVIVTNEDRTKKLMTLRTAYEVDADPVTPSDA